MTVRKPIALPTTAKADAGVAGGAFDDGAAGFEQRRGRIASWMMNSAARSFTDWPGFMNSALPRISQPVSSEAWLRRMSGVLPIAAMTSCRMSINQALKVAPVEASLSGPMLQAGAA